jgi:hypothetical protein
MLVEHPGDVWRHCIRLLDRRVTLRYTLCWLFTRPMKSHGMTRPCSRPRQPAGQAAIQNLPDDSRTEHSLAPWHSGSGRLQHNERCPPRCATPLHGFKPRNGPQQSAQRWTAAAPGG